MPRLSVQQLFEDRRERLALAWAAGASGSHRELTNEMLSRPGLGLIGHLNLIHPLVVQVLGGREVEYLQSLEAGERAAVVLSLIESAKLNGHDPWAYMKDVFERLPTLKQRDLAQLLPHNWRAPGMAAAADSAPVAAAA